MLIFFTVNHNDRVYDTCRIARANLPTLDRMSHGRQSDNNRQNPACMIHVCYRLFFLFFFNQFFKLYKNKIMYYYNDKFYNEVEEIIEDLDLDCMDENGTLKVENCDLEPIITLTADLIADSLENHLEERHSEDCAEIEYNRIVAVLKQNIDFDKINSELPKLWYPNNTFETYSKAQLLSFLE